MTTKKKKTPPAPSICRDCGQTTSIPRYSYFKAARPRCTRCGGTLEYTAWENRGATVEVKNPMPSDVPLQRKRKERKPRRRRNREGAQAISETREKRINPVLEAAEALARQRFLSMRVNEFESQAKGGVAIPNWEVVFGFDGAIVLRWWPTRGTWWCPMDGSKGKTTDHVEAVEIACRKSR